MRERVLAIVSIIAQFVMDDRDVLTENEIVEELLAVGFDADEIDAAFTWMENLSLAPSQRSQLLAPSHSHRVFTSEEARLLTQEAQGFLVKLRFMGILDDDLTEEILDKLLQDDLDPVSLQELKSLTALTLFAHSQDEWCREVDALLEDDWARMYH